MRAFLHLLAWLPLLTMIGLQVQQPNADPQQYMLHGTGLWALTFLGLSLGCTPIRRYAGISKPLRYRRMLGLYAFFYATCHAFVYFGGYAEFSLTTMLQNIKKHPYLIPGVFSLLVLISMAITSPKPMVKKLGRQWKPLHRWVYPASIAVTVHAMLSVKVIDNLLYLLGISVTILLLSRIKAGHAPA